MNQRDNTDKYLYNTVAIHDFNCGIFLFISKMIYWIFHVIIISNLPNLIYNFYFFLSKDILPFMLSNFNYDIPINVSLKMTASQRSDDQSKPLPRDIHCEID